MPLFFKIDYCEKNINVSIQQKMSQNSSDSISLSVHKFYDYTGLPEHVITHKENLNNVLAEYMEDAVGNIIHLLSYSDTVQDYTHYRVRKEKCPYIGTMRWNWVRV